MHNLSMADCPIDKPDELKQTDRPRRYPKVFVKIGASFTARTLSVVPDEMNLLSDTDKRWILRKTVERVWPFEA